MIVNTEMSNTEWIEPGYVFPTEPVKLFYLDDMQYTPFGERQRKGFKGIQILSDYSDADVIISRKMKNFTPEVLAWKKWNLVWTHEPYYDFEATILKMLEASDGSRSAVYVFNTHNGLVYTDNYYYAPSKSKMDMIKSARDINVDFADKTMSFAAGVSSRQAFVAGKDRGVYRLRERLALEAHALGAMRIIGKNWPPGVSEGESRSEGRTESKLLFTKQTNFNFCFENCVSDYYVTEKIWDAISGGCLPIYYPNDTINAIFPKKSYIDGSNFKTAQEMIAHISAIPISEYISRVNKCRKVYNQAVSEKRAHASRQRSVERVLHFLRHAQANPPE